MRVFMVSGLGNLALAAILSLGCSSTIAVRRPLSASTLAEVNDAIEDRSAEVTLASTLRATQTKNLKVGRDETQWLEGGGEERRPKSVPTAALQRITVMAYWRGAAEGLGVGILTGPVVGGLLGGLIGSVSKSPFCEHCNDNIAGPGAIIGAGVGLVLGALVGLNVGAAIGHTTTIDFESESEAQATARQERERLLSWNGAPSPDPLSLDEARAWCARTGRRLPTEQELVAHLPALRSGSAPWLGAQRLWAYSLIDRGVGLGGHRLDAVARPAVVDIQTRAASATGSGRYQVLCVGAAPAATP